LAHGSPNAHVLRDERSLSNTTVRPVRATTRDVKRLHDETLYCWSAFDEARNIDFNSYLWVQDGGNLIVDPLPLSDHDRAHLEALGGAAWIVITNSDHVRDAARLAELTGASIAGPLAEKDGFPIACSRWLTAGDHILGAEVLAMNGSKTPGELALIVEGSTLITGDLVRSHQAGRLHLLPKDKLSDPAAATASVAELAERDIEAVLVGDGWPIFRDGAARLREI
jgi:glyoxylase-like metal-dependent hydrolase (beta-lactamase superfamily II)